MTNFKEAFSAVALATTVGLTGCAGTHFTAPFSDPRDSTVVNRPENRGVQEYGSQACREAGIDVVPGHSLRSSYRGGGAYYSRYSGLYNRSQQLRQSVSVTSGNGQPYTLVPSSDKSRLFEIAGTIGGALAGGSAAHGRRPTQQGLAGVIGAAVGNVAGRMADSFWEVGAREAIDRCRADVMGGAYDRPQRPLGPNYQQQDYQYQQPQAIQGYRRIEPAPGTAPAVECPQGFDCIPQRR